MIDSRVAPHVAGMFAGVSRQAPLMRSPNQMDVLDNFLPSVDHGGLVDRPGSVTRLALASASYVTGPHNFFRTSDGQRWILLRRAEAGNFEVRNLATGALATLTLPTAVQGYLAVAGGTLKFVTLADTTLVLNTAVTTAITVPAVPAPTAAYVFIRRVSSAAQRIYVGRSSGGSCFADLAKDNTDTRDSAATKLVTAINAAGLGLTAYTLGNAPYVVKITGTAPIIAEVTARNSWDESGIVLMKGSVASTSDLPPAFDEGISIAVDQGRGDFKARYFVRYTAANNAWIECSYLDAGATTATLDPATMPVRLRQLTANSFAFEQCAWAPRTKGDLDSNPVPYFAGRKISEIAAWRGRLLLGCQDIITVSQPDDLYNFWKETARESRPADGFQLESNAPELTGLHHIIPFRNKLVVTADNAQLEVPGDRPFTSTDAALSVATRYQIDKSCRPQVVGDALYYTGVAEGRSTLWEYTYSSDSESNTATDLAKHVPGYVPGRLQKITGSSQAGRLFMLTPADPAALYVHTSYFKDQQRVQSAWSRLEFQGLTSILEFWVDGPSLFILARSTGFLWVLEVPVESGLGLDAVVEQRVDFQTPVTVTFNGGAGRSEVTLPTGYSSLGNLILTVKRAQDGWVTDYPLTVAGAIAYVPGTVAMTSGTLGTVIQRRARFSPFYSPDGERNTPTGILQVHQLVLDLLVTGDFLVRIARTDRTPDSVVQRTSRVVGQQPAIPSILRDTTIGVPINARGNKAVTTLESTSTAPLALTGYTLKARYTSTDS